MKCGILVLGPLSRDGEELRYDGTKRFNIGGALVFSSYAEGVAGADTCALVKAAPEDFGQIKDLPVKKIYTADSRYTTAATAVYYTPDRETRDIVISSQADPITVRDIPDVDADIYQMAGLYYGDYDNELFAYLSEKGKVACDMQCYVRYRKGNEIVFDDWADKKKYMPFITYLKTDAKEAEVLTGTQDREEAARIMASWGAKEIMITHNTEVLIYDGEKFYRYPLRPRRLDGRQGRGDTTFGSYLAKRVHHDIDQSLLYAAAAVSLKMERPGVFQASHQEVEDYIKERYPEFL